MISNSVRGGAGSIGAEYFALSKSNWVVGIFGKAEGRRWTRFFLLKTYFEGNKVVKRDLEWNGGFSELIFDMTKNNNFQP